MAKGKKPSAKFQLEGLKVMQSALNKLQGDHFKVQVGIFGNKTVRKDDAGLTNAEVGLIHEMGSVTRNIPRRSFLWDTFIYRGKEMEAALKPLIETLFKKGKVEQYLKEVGIAGENLVRMAFETSGWGAWAQNKPMTIWRKLRGVKNWFKRKQMYAEVVYEGAKHTKPLIDTGQLWQAISSRTAKA